MKATLIAVQARWNKLIIAIIFILLVLAGLLAFNMLKTDPVASAAPAGLVQIAQNTLEEQYGLRVNLVAVTAAGGLVDVRFTFVDGEKVKALLQEPGNFPTLQVAGNPVTLSAPEEGRPAEILYEDGANMFLMYPNAGNLVKAGTPVTIIFGSLQVEPIVAK
jgi:hypothetical protein